MPPFWSADESSGGKQNAPRKGLEKQRTISSLKLCTRWSHGDWCRIESGRFLCDRFNFQMKTQDADQNGGLGHKNASVAGIRGCVAIKCSADDVNVPEDVIILVPDPEPWTQGGGPRPYTAITCRFFHCKSSFPLPPRCAAPPPPLLPPPSTTRHRSIPTPTDSATPYKSKLIRTE